MQQPLISVIIPAYNNAQFLGDAIQSVLAQTYPHFELIVVNDASPDDTDRLMRSLDDPRITYIVHPENRGLSAARNTGMHASKGEYISLLDGDDWFHPEKFERHVAFLQAHADIGVTYNARYELNHSSKTIRELWRPATRVTLGDLVMGFPFSPSDMVMRREWAFRVNLFDVRHTYVGEDLDINCRLALAGCQFASVDRALNYRRFHSGRRIQNLRGSVEDTIRPLKNTFADARCPENVLAIQDRSLAQHYLLWSIIAFRQNETALGQELLGNALKHNPRLAANKFEVLRDTLLLYSTLDESEDHPTVLQNILTQLPLSVGTVRAWYEWLVGRGYLLKGTRAVLWNRPVDAARHFKQAAAQRVECDDVYLSQVTQQLLSYQVEFGVQATERVLKDLSVQLQKMGAAKRARQLLAMYSINRAFHDYQNGVFEQVPAAVMTALSNNPRYLANRGVLSILMRSLRTPKEYKPAHV